MADANHLELLLQGAKAWNAWREKEPSVAPDLSEADLRGGLSLVLVAGDSWPLCAFAASQEKSLHCADTFNLHGAAGLEDETIGQPLDDRGGDLDVLGQSRRF
jgi:hypothetical protein